MKKIAVSVIIPFYNSQQYIKQCLQSVCDQSLKNIEIICVDNGSDDQSVKIISSLKRKDPRITLISIPKSNAGVARNAGLQLAKGEYLSFVDADDFCEPTMLETSYQKAKKENLDLVIFEFNYYDETLKTISNYPYKIPSNIPNSVFSPNNISTVIFNSFQNCPWNKLFKRSFIENNNIRFQEIQRANDLYFTNISLVLSKRIAVIRQPLINYRINNKGSLQNTSEKSPLCSWNAFKYLGNKLQQNGIYSLYEQSFLNELLKNVFYNLDKFDNNSDAFQYLFNTLRYGGDIEFKLSSHPKNYYDSNLYEKYKNVIDSPNIQTIIKNITETVTSDITSSRTYKVGKFFTKIPQKILQSLKGEK